MTTIKIQGMHCEHCVAAVKNALLNLGFQRVEVNLEQNNAIIWDDNADKKTVQNAIEELGFDMVEIK